LVELVGVSEKYYTALRKRLDATFAATLDAWNAYTHSESTRLPELIETNPPEAPRNEAMITNQIKGAYEWLRDTMR